MLSNHLILCWPHSPPAFNLHQHQGLFQWVGSFPVTQRFASGDQSIGVSASTSVLPMSIQDWFPLGLTGLISLVSKGLSRVLSSTTVQKHQFFSAQPSLWFSFTSICDYWKNHSFDYTNVCQQSIVWGILERDCKPGSGRRDLLLPVFFLFLSVLTPTFPLLLPVPGQGSSNSFQLKPGRSFPILGELASLCPPRNIST